MVTSMAVTLWTLMANYYLLIWEILQLEVQYSSHKTLQEYYQNFPSINPLQGHILQKGTESC